MQTENTATPTPVLVEKPEGLTLRDGSMELRADFTKMLARLRKDNLQREYLVKAARMKGAEGILHAIDATAGLGEDAILLAAAGFEVDLYERDPIIAALLRDGLKRAISVPELADIVSRMHLHEEDSIEALRKLTNAPDVIVLDPMFPERKKSASVKKKFQVLHQIEAPCGEEEALLEAAVCLMPKKVLIKRPVKGPFLAGIKPDFSMAGKAIRYDCILPTPALLEKLAARSQGDRS